MLIRNQFKTAYLFEEQKYPDGINIEDIKIDFSLSVDSESGVMLLNHDSSYSEILPSFIETFHIEPEDHLQDIALAISEQIAVTHEKYKVPVNLVSFSYKDNSLVEKIRLILQKRNYLVNTTLTQLNVESALDKFEAQKVISAISTLQFDNQYMNILVMRHAIEHSGEISVTLKNIISCLREQDLVFIELPDSKKLLESKSIALIWECHRAYLTETTAEKLIRNAGGEIMSKHRFEYESEDVLCFTVRKLNGNISLDEFESRIDRVDEVMSYMKAIKDLLQSGIEVDYFNGENEKLVLFGAGHNGLNFAYLLNLMGAIDIIVDDDARKLSKYTPCLKHKIVSTQELQRLNLNSVKVISSLKPKLTDKIMSTWIKKGINVVSYKSVYDVSIESRKI